MALSPATRVHAAMIAGCLISAGLTAYWFETLSGPVGWTVEWSCRHPYFKGHPHMWAPVSVLGPGMLGLLVALALLIVWSLLLTVTTYIGGFGDRAQARSAAAAWWRLRSQQDWPLVIFEIGVVLVLFGVFTWLAAQQPALIKHWKHFLWETLLRNPNYRLQEYTYSEMCSWFSRPALWTGTALMAAGLSICAWQHVRTRRRGLSAASGRCQ